MPGKRQKWKRWCLAQTQARLVFADLLAQGRMLKESEAGFILSNRTPGGWKRLTPSRRTYFIERARKILESISMTLPVYDATIRNGDGVARAWAKLGTVADDEIMERVVLLEGSDHC